MGYSDPGWIPVVKSWSSKGRGKAPTDFLWAKSSLFYFLGTECDADTTFWWRTHADQLIWQFYCIFVFSMVTVWEIIWRNYGPMHCCFFFFLSSPSFFEVTASHSFQQFRFASEIRQRLESSKIVSFQGGVTRLGLYCSATVGFFLFCLQTISATVK